MDRPIIDLMHECVVKLTTPLAEGSGFFVAPGLILTCAHVVEGDVQGQYYEGDINVRWKGNPDFAVARVKTGKFLLDPKLDIALLECLPGLPETPPCVWLGGKCQKGQELAVYGYPHRLEDAEPAAFEFTGYTGAAPPLMKLKMDCIKPGMSGAPILNMETKQVCGMVQFTDDAHSILGGGGIPSDTILANFAELKALQDRYHRQGSRWSAIAGIRLPGDLPERVQKEIEKILSKPRLDLLQKKISNTLKAEHHVSAQSPAETASKLIGMEDSLTLLLRVRIATTDQWHEEGKPDREIASMRSAILDIMGWLVLLAVNTAWIAQNQDKLYPDEFPGAMAMPVETDTGIEIIHAALQERCARFNSNEGKLLGAERMPAIEHEFLEEGFAMEDIVHDIKKAIYQHINRKRGVKERVPDCFTSKEDKYFNAKLKGYNALNKNVYLVVKRSGNRSPLNDRVYKKLKTDLPDLQVIFHESDQAGHAFVVDEIELDSTLEFFFDEED